MTDISFYHLTATPLGKALPRILEKMLEKGHRALVLAPDDAQAEALNGALWTYHPKRFLPHGTKKDGYADQQPIFISTEEENLNNADMLVVTSGQIPETFERYSRCFDFFNGNNIEEVAKARARWQHYKALKNVTLTYWKQDEKGAWQKEGKADTAQPEAA